MTKTVLITGSSSGIGKACAVQLLSQGYHVIGIARDHKKFQPGLQNYHQYTIDLNNIASLEAEFKSIQTAHPTIDIIICNAGIGRFGELEQFSVSQIQSLMNINFISHSILIKTLLPTMKKRQQGKLIFIGSEAALQGQKKGAIYCASKFALRGFAQALRQECQLTNIAVSLINPGMIRTPFFDELFFEPGETEQNAINPQQVVDAIQLIINTPTHCVLEEINLQPLKKQIVKKTTNV